MKKSIPLILASLLVMGLSACQLKKEEPPSSQPLVLPQITSRDEENNVEIFKGASPSTVFITNKQLHRKPPADVIIQLPTNTKIIGDILSIIPLQILAYHLSIARKINPDFPRNLAKVVTVE